MSLAMALGACGGGGPPKQAEAPKVDLDAPPKGSPPEKVVSAQAAEAEAALEAGDYATARAKAQAAVDKAAGDADAHFVLGVCAQKDGDNDGAVTHYKAALAGDATIVSAAANLAGLLADLKRFDEAVEVARSGIAHGGKGVAELHIALGDAFKGQGKHDLAAKSYENAIKLKADDAQLYL
ncbi:MAG: tetratricopeptide repeat protein, partial [Polyangiales bacterium]